VRHIAAQNRLLLLRERERAREKRAGRGVLSLSHLFLLLGLLEALKFLLIRNDLLIESSGLLEKHALALKDLEHHLIQLLVLALQPVHPGVGKTGIAGSVAGHGWRQVPEGNGSGLGIGLRHSDAARGLPVRVEVPWHLGSVS